MGRILVSKVGYHPSQKEGRLVSIVQANKEDEELEKEFVKFYNDKIK